MQSAEAQFQLERAHFQIKMAKTKRIIQAAALNAIIFHGNAEQTTINR